jgi:inhibitor of KinA sporulation pathway (predicted exonuclease)
LRQENAKDDIVSDYVQNMQILEELKSKLFHNCTMAEMDEFDNLCRAKRLPTITQVIENPTYMSLVLQAQHKVYKNDDYKSPEEETIYSSFNDFVQGTKSLSLN